MKSNTVKNIAIFILVFFLIAALIANSSLGGAVSLYMVIIGVISMFSLLVLSAILKNQEDSNEYLSHMCKYLELLSHNDGFEENADDSAAGKSWVCPDCGYKNPAGKLVCARCDKVMPH